MKQPACNLADIIRDDCVIHCPNGKTVSADYIKVLTNVYKKNIYEQLDQKTVGKVGLIWSNKLDTVLPCIKAMWKLGCVVSVHDYREEIVRHPAFKSFYSHIDFVVGTPDSYEIFPDLPHIPAPETQLEFLAYITEKPEKEIHQFSQEDFPDIEYKLDKTLDSECLAVVSHTSGTTGYPKIFGISHHDAINLVYENVKIFNFNQNDRIGHFKTLHHGSLFLNFALPAFAQCSEHFWFIDDKKTFVDSNRRLSAAMQFCADNNLTKFMIHYPFFLNDHHLRLSDPIDVSETNIISTISPSESFMRNFFQKFNPASVYNNFGCTEIGTIAVSQTTRQNLSSYRPNRFDVINGIIDINPGESSFWVKYKTQKKWREIGDVIALVDNGLIFHGRNNKIKLHGKNYEISAINDALQKIGCKNFSLVPDFENHMLYLAFFRQTEYDEFSMQYVNNELAKLFDHLPIISKSNCFTIDTVMQGIKPSQPLLIYAFRNQ